MRAKGKDFKVAVKRDGPKKVEIEAINTFVITFHNDAVADQFERTTRDHKKMAKALLHLSTLVGGNQKLDYRDE
jgi:hypothetical protein